MRFFLACAVLLSVISCSKQKDDTLRVGVTSGPHAIILEHVIEKAQKDGQKIEMVTFDDFTQPNIALDAGDIDMNVYQHQPFLTEEINTRHFDFEVLGKAILLPMGIYGAPHISDLKNLKSGAKVLIPVDPSNNARALKLLEKAGLVTLVNHTAPTVKDVCGNPLKLHFIQVEAPLMPRLLKDDADIAVLNADWAIVANIDRSAILFQEDVRSPYTNLFVIKTQTKKRPQAEKFMQSYQSKDTERFIEQTFQGAVRPAW